MIRRREPQLKKGLFELIIEETTFLEKLVLILWCGLPYLVWMMADGLELMYKIPISIGIWILLSLLCYWFGNFMSSDQRDWN